MHLSVADAAALLGTTERQVYRWVDEGDIPFQRVHEQVRFNRTEVLEWATSRRLRVSLEAFDAGLDVDERPPSLAAALRLGGVHLDVAATDRAAALRAVVLAVPMPASVDRGLLAELMIARELSSSTAIGDGIAIPHVRHPVVAAGSPPCVGVAHLSAPLPFGAADGKPVKTLFLIISPTVKAHLQMLAQLARALHDPRFREALDRRAPTEELAQAVAPLEIARPAAVPPSGEEVD